MTKERLNLGYLGESRCISFLKRKGYKIIERNYRCPLGEIDIIARDKDTLCFIEVKTRRAQKFGLPQEAVNQRKRNKLVQAALSYIKKKNLENSNLRFDVIAILEDIQLIKDAFSVDNKYRY